MLKSLIAKTKALWSIVPQAARREFAAAATTAALAFGASFVALLPGILAAPNLTAGRSLTAAAVIAALAAAKKAALPALRGAVASLAGR
jgi:hypothetical protein